MGRRTIMDFRGDALASHAVFGRAHLRRALRRTTEVVERTWKRPRTRDDATDRNPLGDAARRRSQKGVRRPLEEIIRRRTLPRRFAPDSDFARIPVGIISVRFANESRLSLRERKRQLG